MQKYKHLAWLFWSISALFYFYEFLIQVSPNVMAKELAGSLKLDPTLIGLIGGAFGYAYSFMQIPAGILLDRFGPSRLLSVASVFIACGCYIFAIADNFYLAYVGRFIIGIGASGAVVGSMKIAANWFKDDEFAFVLGLTVSIGMAGAIAGNVLVSYLMHFSTITYIFISLSVVGLIFAAVFLFVVKDKPKHKSMEKAVSLKELVQGLSVIIRIPSIWYVAIYGLLMFGPTLSFCGMWGGPFFELKYQISKDYAGYLTSLIFVGWLIGSPLCGYISDSLNSRTITIKYGSPAALIIFLLIVYAPINNFWVLQFLLVAFGIASSGFLTSFSIIKEISPPSYTASTMGFMNTMNSSGAAVLMTIIGLILSFLQGTSFESASIITNISDYYYALMVLPISLFLSTILIPLIPETKCKNIYDK